MEEKLVQLKSRLNKVNDLSAAAFVLEWDQETYMPEGSSQARADQIGTLKSMAHQTFVDEETGELFDDLASGLSAMEYDSDEASLIRVGKREYEKLVRVPSDLVEEMAAHRVKAQHTWQRARADNDFKLFEPLLEKTFELQRRFAACFKPSGNPYDALLNYYETGIDAEQIKAVFTPLRPKITDLVKAITDHASAVDDSPLHQYYPQEQQLAFSKQVSEAIGYSFKRGRLDLTAHPFQTSFGPDDARITTRVNENFLPTCLMGVIHESGHAIYDLNVSKKLYRLGLGAEARLGEGTSMSIHESQSRFYENTIGRSHGFWKFMYPKLQAAFPDQLGSVSMEAFYKAINQSEPSLIRVEADEVTYGLHIMLRFELEDDLINDRVKVKDLPQVWNDRMEAYLGIRPETDSEGVMQDIHWSAGLVGYFPDYLLGSILSIQWWNKMIEELPSIPSEIETGKFDTILHWLSTNIHQHGRKFTMNELTQRVLGTTLQWQPYLDYLTSKYSEIYGF